MRQADASHATFRRSRAAVTATFATHAVISGSVGPWIPRLKADSGLDAEGLGLALTGYAVGLLVGTRLTGPAVRRFGGRNVVRVGIPALASGLALLPFASGLPALGVVFAAFGLAAGLLDVAMNAEAVAVERRFGRRVMSPLHGTWSVSVLAGAAIASGAIVIDIPIRVHLPALAALLVASSSPLLRWLPAPHEARREFALAAVIREQRSPIRRVALLSILASAAFLTEGVATEWSAVYLREAIQTDAGTAGLGVVAFSAGMAASRFAGDRLTARFDATTVAHVGASIGGVVLAAALVAGGSGPAIASFAVLGLGLGPVVPLAFRAAGALALGPGRSALGIVVTAGYVGSIAGPLLVGFTADRAGLPEAFAIPVAMCIAVAIAASSIREREG